MHERGLVSGLLAQIREVVSPRSPGCVRAVHLTVGEFTGVEPELVRSAFEELAPAVLHHRVQLQLQVVRLAARCRACAEEFDVERFHFVCPSCACDNVEIIAGEQFELTSLTIEPLIDAACPGD